ncbi:CapA family protein [Polyangium sp. y55x31]|uniref:CapA family protein n=1 Tax=Polyangium sp. y55x31 TaxID=3042688 RepID=UPI00248227CA|nr:CapA family protein [Polyangium sp. y55x31]MDI1475524.1 CapA family protein [Polyangium sp. y55x31]
MAETHITGKHLRAGLVCLGAASAFAPAAAHAQPYQFDTSETTFDTNYAQNLISLSGTVKNRAGQAISGATVTVLAWGDGVANANKTATTNASGGFTITGLKRRNVLLKITAPGHYSEIVPVDLHRPTSETITSTGTIAMNPTKTGRVRLIFGGDTMMGRRFTDLDADGIEGEAGDLIRPATRAADAQALYTYVRDALSSADYTVVNLESPVTSNTDTPHPYKDYTFFSYPETLAGLTYAGIDGVSLANNHIFDYLTTGVTDSMLHVSNAGLDWCGVGSNETNAEGTTIFRTFNNVPLSLLGFSELVSDGSTELDYLLVARDPSKAGALESSSTNLNTFIDAETPERFAIPMIHGGVEYSEYPSNSMRSKFISLANRGAGIVVAHHTHTAHGIGLVNVGGTPRFVLMSLGNFVFDQDVHETFQSFLAVADVDVLAGGGFDVARLDLIPISIEGYVTKLVAGEGLARTGRHFGHLSTYLPKSPAGVNVADGLSGAVVFPAGHRIVALRSASQYTTTTTNQTFNAPVTSQATGPIVFTRNAPSDSLSYVKSSASATVEWGRELLINGDFEDLDVDGDFSEGRAWDQSTVRYVENSVVRSGTGALVMLRNSSNSSEITVYNNNRVSFPGGSKLTITGWIQGDNAGPFTLTTRMYSDSGATLSTTDSFTKTAGTYGWTQFVVNVTASASATSARFYFRTSPPATGEARIFIDDFGLIRWEKSSIYALNGFEIPAPNNWSHVRFTNVASGVSSLGVTLGHRTFSVL